MTIFSRKRTMALGASLVLAALATVLLVGYVRALERRVESQGDPVEVWVAAEQIPAGTPVDEARQNGLFLEETVARRSVAEGAIASLDEISGRNANADVFAGEQIVSGRFDEGRRDPLLTIPSDRQAMAVEVGSPPGVAGYVQKGDHVSLLAKAATPEGATVRFLVQDVEVLAVGRQGEDGGGLANAGGGESVVLTLSLTPDEVERVGYAVLDSNVYFTLLPKGQGPHQTPGRTAQNLFS